MPDTSVKVVVTLTSWHEWQPFGLSDAAYPAAFGISVIYSPSDGSGDQQLALDTMSIDSMHLSAEIRSHLDAIHQATVADATTRMNSLPYQLPIF